MGVGQRDRLLPVRVLVAAQELTNVGEPVTVDGAGGEQHDRGRAPPDPQRLEQRGRIGDPPVGVVEHHQHRRHHAREPLDARGALRQGARVPAFATQPVGQLERESGLAGPADAGHDGQPGPVTGGGLPTPVAEHGQLVAVAEPDQLVLGAQQPQRRLGRLRRPVRCPQRLGPRQHRQRLVIVPPGAADVDTQPPGAAGEVPGPVRHGTGQVDVQPGGHEGPEGHRQPDRVDRQHLAVRAVEAGLQLVEQLAGWLAPHVEVEQPVGARPVVMVEPDQHQRVPDTGATGRVEDHDHRVQPGSQARPRPAPRPDPGRWRAAEPTAPAPAAGSPASRSRRQERGRRSRSASRRVPSTPRAAGPAGSPRSAPEAVPAGPPRADARSGRARAPPRPATTTASQPPSTTATVSVASRSPAPGTSRAETRTSYSPGAWPGSSPSKPP